jgi:hypothetical protein
MNIPSTLLPFNAKYNPICTVDTIKDLLTSNADSTHHFLPTTRRQLRWLDFQRLDPKAYLDRLCLKNYQPIIIGHSKEAKGKTTKKEMKEKNT